MRPKPKVLFVISEDTYIRNYLSTGALEELSAETLTYLAFSTSVSKTSGTQLKTPMAGQFTLNNLEKERHQRLLQVYAWRYRKLSRTFFYRWLRQSNWQMVTSTRTFLSATKQFAKWLIGVVTNPNLLLPIVAGSGLAFPIARRLLESKIVPNSDIVSIMDSQTWDLVVIPTSGADPALFDFIAVAEQMDVPTLALVDNWDNLVSKTIFWKKPNFIGVWGPQSKKQAVEIHGFKPEVVTEIGNPRFEKYFHFRKPGNTNSRASILFAGSAMPFDELGALHSLESSMIKFGLEDLQIRYRPHPWQQKRLVRSEFLEKEFHFTTLDSQIQEAKILGLQKTSTDPAFQPDLSYYPRLFKESLLVVGPLTTMLLEASLCLRPVIALNYNDGFHFTTRIKYFSHFSGMERVPGFRFCDDRNDLPDHLLNALSDLNLNPDIADRELAHFVSRSSQKYGEKLAFLAREIVGTRQ